MKERIAVIDGIRTPFCKAGGQFRDLEADDLGAVVIKELLARSPVPAEEISEVIFGNVIQPSHAANIARVLSIKGGIPEHVPAFTVNRNCASGMEAVASSMNKILNDEASIIIAGGTESMSRSPILFGNEMRRFLIEFSKAKSLWKRIKLFFSLRPRFFAPILPAIADPTCDMSMGQTAELVARDFKITRQEQDEFGAMSQQRAAKAQEEGKFIEEIIPVPIPPKFNTMQKEDDGIRKDTTVDGLSKLKPAFDPITGSVTAGTSSQITDGAVALLLMRESEAKKRGLKPLGYVSAYSYAALDPRRMGLGPAFAISKLLDKTGLSLKDIDLIEINEAFAAQVIAVERALASEEFAKTKLKKEKPVGVIDRNKLNVNGGAIALGHPIGASGARIILSLLKELKRRGGKKGIASLCVGGGQGQAVLLEVE
jgi:acetyl-CoA acyltransferase